MTRSRIGREDGFTLLEVLVAVVLLLIGIFASFAILDNATRTAINAQRHQVAVNQAQKAIEDIRSLNYDNIALNANVSHSSNSTDPNYRVSGNNFDLTKDPSTTNNAQLAEPATGSNVGSVVPGPTPFTDGHISGNIYRYVVWQDDPGCLVTCPGTQDFKRVVVAVKLDASSSPVFTTYAEIQSNFTDPNATVLGSLPPVNPAPGTTVTAQQLWLYDSPCSGNRSDPSASHSTHNTTGDCSSNPADLMWNDAPPDPDSADPANPPYYNYSTDLTGGTQGLRMLTRNGCGSESDKNKVHRWETKPLPLAFTTTTRATFDFFTKTTGASGSATICVRVIKRTYVVFLPVDTVLGTQTYTNSAWPSNAAGWTELSFSINTLPITSLINDRLIFELYVDSSSSVSPQFMYDHPDTPTRVEIGTTTPL